MLGNEFVMLSIYRLFSQALQESIASFLFFRCFYLWGMCIVNVGWVIWDTAVSANVVRLSFIRFQIWIGKASQGCGGLVGGGSEDGLLVFSSFSSSWSWDYYCLPFASVGEIELGIRIQAWLLEVQLSLCFRIQGVQLLFFCCIGFRDC